MLSDISNGIWSLVNYFQFLFYELQEGISDFGVFGGWLSDLTDFLPSFLIAPLGAALAVLCFNKFFRMK